MSKSSGSARDLIILSRSSLVRRFSFALLHKLVSMVVTIPSIRRLTCFETRPALVVGLVLGSLGLASHGVPHPDGPDEQTRSSKTGFGYE